jgi:Holliday junction resolvase RusA-like endonuclease
MIRFTIPSKPAGQPRARVGVIGGHARAFKSKKAHTLEQDVLAFAAPAAPATRREGAVRVRIEARMPIPGGWPVWKQEAALAGMIRPTSRPDADNVAKLVLDALNRSGRFWRDDAQVVELTSLKWYGAAPETVVEVQAVDEVRDAATWKAIQPGSVAASPTPAKRRSRVPADLFGGIVS